MNPNISRRALLAMAAATLASRPAWAAKPSTGEVGMSLDVTRTGAVGDDKTLNTLAIQRAIDQLAQSGGGTVVVPAGVFVSGALFLKPGVHLHLDQGAVLKCSTDLSNFPPQRTWIEGHYEAHFNPALINASGCHGLRITGEGTLDGDGRPVWDLFWKLRKESGKGMEFRNLDVPRARMVIIEKSQDVLVEGITFKDSQYWNLHLYHCQRVQVRNASFQVPDDYVQAPSTDGIDVDSSQDVNIVGCHFSVTDDCIALKGAKGPDALGNPDSPPVERIRVSGCTFRRGHAAVNMGSEATIVRDVQVDDCVVTGGMSVASAKLRPDTPQTYEHIHFRNLRLDAPDGLLIRIYSWTQYVDLKGREPPKSLVQDFTISGVKGRYGGFGSIAGNPGQTTLRDIRISDVDVDLLEKPELQVQAGVGLSLERVRVNGRDVTGRSVPQASD